jgi:8-oxo-dGTP pyrophosphatase MutT (NUDIX family)
MTRLRTPVPTPAPLAVHTDVSWAPLPNTVSLHPATDVPEPWTMAICLLIRSGVRGTEVLLVNVTARGLDAPGGHREPGETTRETTVREVAEETGLVLAASTPVTLLGYQHLHVAGPVPTGYGYPHPDSYAAITAVTVPAGTEPTGTTMPEEISGHTWLPLDQVPTACPGRTWLPFLTLL